MKKASSLRILGTRDAVAWLAVLQRAQQHDFHHLPQYHAVAEEQGEGEAQLFVFEEGEHIVALPLLLRAINPEDQAGWFDATSVYGYGGPIASQADVPGDVVARFQAALSDELDRRRVVSVFSRLHPLIEQQGLLAGLGECPDNGGTISIDLTLPEEAQRAKYNKSCRRALRQLREAGFVGFHDEEKRYLSEFTEVYLETMRRAGAQSSYYFDEAYFNALTHALGSASHLFVALKDGRVAAATLCTVSSGIVQDHLGGTRDAFLEFSPDRLVVDTERAWATTIGARVFHLGGGVGAQQDSVFRYKAGFSDCRHTFRTWRWIIRPDVYGELCTRAAQRNAENGVRAISDRYFPAYRCPTIDAAAEETSPFAEQLVGKEGCLHA
ncbi:MAG: GNAT family N-acetyltransferase [Verrucomicrobiota bacterium]|nr:GNAT family N-acetyltransferase [Verrucomicrobiota bacterium]